MSNTPNFIPGSIIPPKKKEPYRAEFVEDVHDKNYLTSARLDFNGSGYLYRMSSRIIEQIEEEVPSTPFSPKTRELTHLHRYATLLKHAQKVSDTLTEDTHSGITVVSDKIRPYLTERKTKLDNLIKQRKANLIKVLPELYLDLLADIP